MLADGLSKDQAATGAVEAGLLQLFSDYASINALPAWKNPLYRGGR